MLVIECGSEESTGGWFQGVTPLLDLGSAFDPAQGGESAEMQEFTCEGQGVSGLSSSEVSEDRMCFILLHVSLQT